MNDVWLLIAGAGLAIIGGGAGDELRSWRERSRELSAIKICISDELAEIEATIQTMHQVWQSAQLFHPSYVTNLIASTSAYDSVRQRMFLIKDSDLRKEIADFYKKLKDAAHSTEGKIGTLAQTSEATNEQAALDASFLDLGKDAKALKAKLDA